MIQDTDEFKNGLTAGIILCVGQLLREDQESVAKNIMMATGINAKEDLSFCSDFDLEPLREYWIEFEHVFAHDADPDQVWRRDDERTILTTLLISDEHFNGPITEERVANWSDEDCKAVESYCRAVHINASDNPDFGIPPKPKVLGNED